MGSKVSGSAVGVDGGGGGDSLSDLVSSSSICSCASETSFSEVCSSGICGSKTARSVSVLLGDCDGSEHCSTLGDFPFPEHTSELEKSSFPKHSS